MDPRIQTVIAVIEERPERKFRIEELARLTHISVSHLRHLFKSETQMPLAEFVKTARLRRAESLLRTTFLSVKEVMGQAGFLNESHFSREFRKAYGLAPGRYRASISDKKAKNP